MRNQAFSKSNFSKMEARTLQLNNIEEIEKSVLVYIISNVDSSEVALKSLHVEDFETETHRLIFEAIENLHFRGNPIDLLTMHGELSNTPRPNGENWVSYLTYILETALPIVEGNIEFHVAKLKEASRLRRTSEVAYSIHEAAMRDDSENVQSLIEALNEAQINTATINRLKPIPAKDLPNVPPPESLWGGILYPGCITQLNAEPGAGKSTLLYNIASFGALGKDFLGIPFSRPIKTLYIDLESPQWLQKQKIETICGELPANLHLLYEFNLRRDVNELIKLAKEEKYDLIVFDTQSKALGMEDENDNSEANRMAILLRRLARETGAAILLIHHTKKGDGGKKVHKGRGASAIAGDVDVVANLETLDLDTLKLEIAKTRIPGVFQSITMRKVGDDKFERISIEGGHRGSELQSAQEFILSLLGDRREWRTAEILERAEKEGFKKKTIENALRRLWESGRLLRPRQGVYSLPGNTLY